MASRFLRIRSEPVGGRKLSTLCRELFRRLGKNAEELASPGAPGSYTLLRAGFDPLDAFDRVQSVAAARPVGPRRADRSPYLDAIRRQGPGKSRMYLSLRGTEAGIPTPPPDVLGGLRLSFGWQMDQVGENYPSFSFEIGAASPGFADLGHRRDLFLRLLDLAGLAGIIRVDREGDKLRAVAAPGWTAAPISSLLGGLNPLGIAARGFPSIAEALEAGERAADAAFGLADACEFAAYAKGKNGYKAILRPLEAIDRDWNIGVGGELSAATGSVIAGAPGPRAPLRVPAFSWEANEFGSWFAYAAELAADGDGAYCLEIATDQGDPGALSHYARFLGGLRFAPAE